MSNVRWREIRRIAAGGLAVASGIFVLTMLPVLPGYLWSCLVLVLPGPLSTFLRDSHRLWLAVLLAIPLQIVSDRVSGRHPVADSLHGFSSQVLRRGIPALFTLAAALMVASWLPHYLAWPWWIDVEHFALSALSWDAGASPYRDLYDFNFPGPMYLHWFLGKSLGWGRTAPYYVVDAALLLGFCAMTVSWSRERFGGVLPGLVPVLALLGYYCALDYSLVAQRDWQVPLLAAWGLMALESWPGRRGRLAASALFAAAFSFRPHVVVFVPAYLAALDENARAPGESWRETAVAWLEWSLAAGFGCALAFLPLIVTGTLDDYLFHFREAFSGGYRETGRRSFLRDLAIQVGFWKYWLTLVALISPALLTGQARRRTTLTWALALIFVVFYRPLSPVDHGYLQHPLVLVLALSLAFPASWLIQAPRLSPLVRCVGILALAWEVLPQVPAYCQPRVSLAAIRHGWQGRPSPEAPPGCRRAFTREASNPYQWGGYQRVLAHLRRRTGRTTRVANFLRSYPFPALNGPTGRLSPFPSVAGILWLRWVDASLEPEFAEAIARPGDAVVVWMPDLKPGLHQIRLPLIEAAVRRHYAPEAKFGAYEVWRRKGGPAPGDPGSLGRIGATRQDLGGIIEP